MELEFQRKLITLENSVKDIDERLAELYRETAGLTLHKAALIQKVKRDAAASKKHASEVKRIHSDLKSGLDDVSEKLARMDTVIKKLNSMRREVRKEKNKEFSGLSSSILTLNKRVSKMNKLVENVRATQHDPRIDVLQRELADFRKITSEKPAKTAYDDMNSSVERLERMLSRKIDDEQLRDAVGDVNTALESLEDMIDQKIDSGQLRDALGDVSGALSAEIDSLQKRTLDSLTELESKLDATRKESGSKLDKVDKLASAQSRFSQSLSSLEKQLRDVESSISDVSKRAKVGVASPIDLKKIDDLSKRVDTIRERANAILKEIYDTMDALHASHATFQNQVAQNADELKKAKKKLSVLEKQVKILPRGTVGEEAELDISGLVAEVEELRSYIDTLIKGLDVSKVLTEEMKAIEAKLASIDEWKSRMTEFPRELERLAERMAELETAKAPGQAISPDVSKAQTDVENLKMTVAELSNKLNLINTLALENQKLQNRVFILEDRLRSSKTASEGN